MAISTYPLIRSAVWDLLDINQVSQTDFNTAKTDILLAGSEDQIYRDIKTREMETALSSTVITSSGLVALPADYIELKNAYIDGSPSSPLQRKSAEWIYQKYPTRSSDGKPKFIAREGSNFLFGPFPDSSYLVKGIYYAKTVVAGTSAALTGMLATSPLLWVFKGASDVAIAMGNAAYGQIWNARYQDLKKTITETDDREEYSGSPPAVTQG